MTEGVRRKLKGSEEGRLEARCLTHTKLEQSRSLSTVPPGVEPPKPLRYFMYTPVALETHLSPAVVSVYPTKVSCLNK